MTDKELISIRKSYKEALHRADNTYDGAIAQAGKAYDEARTQAGMVYREAIKRHKQKEDDNGTR